MHAQVKTEPVDNILNTITLYRQENVCSLVGFDYHMHVFRYFHGRHPIMLLQNFYNNLFVSIQPKKFQFYIFWSKQVYM